MLGSHILAVFANPESWDWRIPNPGILGLQQEIWANAPETHESL